MPFVSSVRGSYGVQSRRLRETGRLGTGSTGGTITTSGGYRIHSFTSVGTSTFVPDFVGGTVELLIIAGGGAGGSNLGGGGGAVVGGGGGGAVVGGGGGGGAGGVTQFVNKTLPHKFCPVAA